MFIDNLITRYPNGVTNNAIDNIFNSMPVPDITRLFTFYDDFFDFVPTAWTVTETQAGATQTLIANGHGGRLLLTNTAADNDINQVQKPAGAFGTSLQSGRSKFFMKARFQISDVVQSDFAIGVQLPNADGTDLAVATAGIFFHKLDGLATLDFYVRQNVGANSVSATSIATLVNATDVNVACFFDGVDRMYYGVNGTVLGYVTVSATTLPLVGCAPIITLKNGEAVAKTATIDGIFVAQERAFPY